MSVFNADPLLTIKLIASKSEVKVIVLVEVNVDSRLALVELDNLLVGGRLFNLFVRSSPNVPREAQCYSLFRIYFTHSSLVNRGKT